MERCLNTIKYSTLMLRNSKYSYKLLINNIKYSMINTHRYNHNFVNNIISNKYTTKNKLYYNCLCNKVSKIHNIVLYNTYAEY